MIPYPYFVGIASGISKYPEIVKEILIELENELKELDNCNTKYLSSNESKLTERLHLEL